VAKELRIVTTSAEAILKAAFPKVSVQVEAKEAVAKMLEVWYTETLRAVSQPDSASWLNVVERWFGVLDDKAIRRGVFRSAEDLKAAIEAFLTVWNQDPQPFVWTATVESITERLSRCRRTLETIQPGCTSTRTKKRKN
jgi:hypothetical protein